MSGYADTVHPDTGHAMGTPPVNGAGGERGTSAFAGNSLYNADGTLKASATPDQGPARGKDYYTSVYPQAKSTGTSAVTVH